MGNDTATATGEDNQDEVAGTGAVESGNSDRGVNLLQSFSERLTLGLIMRLEARHRIQASRDAR